MKLHIVVGLILWCMLGNIHLASAADEKEKNDDASCIGGLPKAGGPAVGAVPPCEEKAGDKKATWASQLFFDKKTSAGWLPIHSEKTTREVFTLTTRHRKFRESFGVRYTAQDTSFNEDGRGGAVKTHAGPGGSATHAAVAKLKQGAPLEEVVTIDRISEGFTVKVEKYGPAKHKPFGGFEPQSVIKTETFHYDKNGNLVGH